MSWFWMNIPAALACVAAWCGIPLYMVLKHKSWSTEPADSVEPATVKQPAAAKLRAAAPAPLAVASVPGTD